MNGRPVGDEQAFCCGLISRAPRFLRVLVAAAGLLLHDARAVHPPFQTVGDVHLSGDFHFDGVLEVESFTLSTGTRLLFAEDLTLRSSGPIVIDGDVLGLSRNELVSRSGDMRGANLIIESATSITVRGAITGAEGRHGNLSPFARQVLGVDTDFTDARPGQLTDLLAEQLRARGDLRDADGGLLFAGGDGGSILLRAPVVWVGGSITGGHGGDGGNGGAAVARQRIPEETAGQILKASVGAAGDNGSDQIGNDWAAGGAGAHGTCNWPGASAPGGKGGDGGNGLPGTGTHGMAGGSGRSQCAPQGTGKAGGNGGKGGKGTGGAGGPGGSGGNGINLDEGVCTASCGGEGGKGGNGVNGTGGNGGNPGSGGAGCPGGPPGQGGRGGAAVAGGHGAGGARGVHGTGIVCGGSGPGESGTDGTATTGDPGGIGAYGVQCQDCR